jgi:hypothetical protein
MNDYGNYFFELLLIPQVEGDVEQRQEGVDKLEKCHFAYQMIIIFRLFPIILYRKRANECHLVKYEAFRATNLYR